jgi:hypothetical protein
MAFYDVIGNRADAFEAHSLVKPLSSPIERGHAEKHIGLFAENSLFDMFNQQCSNASISPLRHHAEEMNVTSKWSAHIQQNEANNLLALGRDVSFAQRVHQWLDTMLVSATQCDPGLGGLESASADFGLGFASHAAD